MIEIPLSDFLKTRHSPNGFIRLEKEHKTNPCMFRSLTTNKMKHASNSKTNIVKYVLTTVCFVRINNSTTKERERKEKLDELCSHMNEQR